MIQGTASDAGKSLIAEGFAVF
jgi:hypothetical protein